MPDILDQSPDSDCVVNALMIDMVSLMPTADIFSLLERVVDVISTDTRPEENLEINRSEILDLSPTLLYENVIADISTAGDILPSADVDFLSYRDTFR